jgi:hypothetical protein
MSKKVPEFLLPMPRSKLVPPSAANVNANALARHFRKGYFQAFRRWPSRTYMAPIARQKFDSWAVKTCLQAT